MLPYASIEILKKKLMTFLVTYAFVIKKKNMYRNVVNVVIQVGILNGKLLKGKQI